MEAEKKSTKNIAIFFALTRIRTESAGNALKTRRKSIYCSFGPFYTAIFEVIFSVLFFTQTLAISNGHKFAVRGNKNVGLFGEKRIYSIVFVTFCVRVY